MACTNPTRLQKDFSISSLKATETCKGIQESLGIWTPGTGVRILCQWNLDSLEVFRIP